MAKRKEKKAKEAHVYCHIIWENGMSMMKIEERGKI